MLGARGARPYAVSAVRAPHQGANNTPEKQSAPAFRRGASCFPTLHGGLANQNRPAPYHWSCTTLCPESTVNTYGLLTSYCVSG